MQRVARLSGALLFAAGLGSAVAAAPSGKSLPYWASLAKGEARMRVGPSLDYPASWVYQRRDLPVKVVEVYSNWRKIEDPDGTQGWMHVRLLKDEPTAIVRDHIAVLRDRASTDARALYRLEPGVVGRLSGCSDGWCGINVNGVRGYVLVGDIWGATE